jgi:hypothetical protein
MAGPRGSARETVAAWKLSHRARGQPIPWGQIFRPAGVTEVLFLVKEAPELGHVPRVLGTSVFSGADTAVDHTTHDREAL